MKPLWANDGSDVPECYGRYAHFLYEESGSAEECMNCRVSTHCYQVTSCDALTSLASNLGLLIDNLLHQGRIQEHRDICPECGDDPTDDR